MGLFKLIELWMTIQSLVADVEADHGERPAGLEDDLRRFRIAVDIGFGGGVRVPGPEIEPPIRITSFTRGTIDGSFSTGKSDIR